MSLRHATFRFERPWTRVRLRAALVLAVALMGFMLAGPVGPASAATLTVTSCADSGAGTLRAKVAAAADGDTIMFGPNCTISLSTEIAISGKTLTIDAGGKSITVDGGHATRLFNVDSTGTLTVSNLSLANGSPSGDGGAISNTGALTVRNSTFSGNSANVGGGILNVGTATVQNSTFTGNSAGVGGGIENYATLTIDNSTFTGNSATFSGAVDNQTSGTMTVRNSTFAGNTANFGGLVYNQGSAGFANTIASANSGGQCAGSTAVTDSGNNLQSGDTTCGFGTTANPLLGSLASNGGKTQTMALSEGSPAIGAGDATTCQAAGIDNKDQRGSSRRADTRGRCDIGAYDTRGSVPGALSAAKTTMTRSAASIVADGSSTSTITVQARDASGLPLTHGGSTVDVVTTRGSVSTPATDNGNGSYTATLTSSTAAGPAKVTGTIDGGAIGGSATVTFTAGPASATTTTIKSDKQKISADGTSTATITVQAKDQYGNLIMVGGPVVTLSTDAGSVGTVTDLGNGRYTATLTSATSPGTATISGTIGGNPISSTATVVFTNPTVTNCNDSGPGSLRAIVAGAPSGSTIVFALNCTITLASQISISGTLTIDGTGHSIMISGGNATRIFVTSGNVTLSRLTLVNGNGSGDIGGAIFNGGTLTVRDSTLTGNHGNQGGAIFNGGTLAVQSSTISGNTSDYGGGIKNVADLTVDNSTFTGNDAGGASGALDNQATGTITVRNSTFVGNTSPLGGLIYNQGPATFTNTIVSQNTGGQCAGPAGVSNGGNNLQFGDATCGFSTTANPLLGSLASNGGPTQTMALGEGSPAIGAGNATTCQAAGIGNLDQRGMSRRADVRGRCDIGAYDTRGFVAGALNAAKSTIMRTPDKIVANGVSSATITVQARDASGLPLHTGGATVVLQTTAGTLSPTVTDNGNGTYTSTLTSSTTAGSAKVTGTINGGAITGSAGVTFVAGAPSGATTTIMRNPAMIPANGTSTSTITVQAKDQYGNLIKVGGATVLLNSDAGSLGTVTDLGNGRYVATLTSDATPGTATVSGTIDGDPITATAVVSFT